MTPSDYQKRYVRKHPEKVAEYQKEYWRKNKERKLYYHAKDRASRFGLEFNITLEDIVIPEFCPVLGIPIQPGVLKVWANSPSLDRVDSSKGYVKGNVEVISHKANRLKGALSSEEGGNLLRYMEQQRKD